MVAGRSTKGQEGAALANLSQSASGCNIPSCQYVVGKRKNTIPTVSSAIPSIDVFANLATRAIESAATGKTGMEVMFDDSHNLHFRIHGEGWDDKVDYRIAKFVLDLQAAVDTIQSEITGYNVSREDRIIVKVQHKLGSSDLWVEVGSLLKRMTKNLTPNQKVLLISLSIMTIGGCYCTSKYLDYRKEIDAKIQDEKTKQELVHVIAVQEARREELERPLRSLLHHLGEHDTILVPAVPDPMTKEEAKKLFPRKARSGVSLGYFDAKYVITSIDFEGDLPAVHLSLENHPLKAELKLTDPDLDRFYGDLRKLQSIHGAEVEMELQVTAKYSASGIREAEVVGIGPVRPNSLSILDVSPKDASKLPSSSAAP